MHSPLHSPSLILASGSPRRRDLLNSLGLRFTVRPVDLDESVRPGEEPAPYVERLAGEKARAQAQAGEVILAADTIVVLDGEILGKPQDAAEARRVLARMQGRWHTVMTAVALSLPKTSGLPQTSSLPQTPAGEAVTVERARVFIGELSAPQIATYVATGEPMDKAGSYGIQGRGALLVEKIDGNYGTVVGLPLPATARLFRQLGLEMTDFAQTTRRGED